MIMSPFVLDRNVPYWDLREGGQNGANGDESEGAGEGRGTGAGEEQGSAGGGRGGEVFRLEILRAMERFTVH